MAYINLKLLKEKGYTIKDFMILQTCKQQKFEDLSEFLIDLTGDEETLLKYEDVFLVKFVKGKMKNNLFQNARTTDRANELLEDLETPEVQENDLILFEWVKKKYLSKGKEVGNAKKAKLYIALFRVHSGIDGNRLAFLIKHFLDDDAQQAWSIRADYIFFKPANAFQVKFDINESKLWKFYTNNKEFFDREFEKIS